MRKTAGWVCIECKSRDCVHVAAAPPAPLLTVREQLVLCFVGAGYSNKEIAWRAHLGEDTVKVTLRRAYAKLKLGGAGSRVQAALWVRENAELLGAPKAA